MQPERADMNQDLGALSGSQATPGAAEEASPPIGFDPARLGDGELQAILDSELVSHVRGEAKRVTGGNCMFADDDVRFLAELATLALDAGLHDGIITDNVTLCQIEQARADRAAIATEAHRAETVQLGSVHEGAGPKDIAQGPSQ